MSPFPKLAGFAAVLALVFAGAAFAGSRIDVHPGGGAATAAPRWARWPRRRPQPVRGLAVSDHGLTLELARATARPGEPFELAFRIADRRGETVRDFDVEHTKRMHFIVVRRDMTGFQHLHPTQARRRHLVGPGDAARRRLLPRVRRLLRRRQAAHAGRRPRPWTARVRSQPLPAPAESRRRRRPARASPRGEPAGESQLAFTVTRDGKPVAVERLPRRQGPPGRAAPGRPRLPARASRRGQPALHGRRSRPRAATACSCSSRADGRVHTAAFTREVSR